MAIDATPEIRRVPVASLKPAPYNPRRIEPAAMAGLEKSLERFGVVEPIIFNQRSGFVVGGHQRLKVLRRKKVRQADVVVVDLDETDEKALNVALNNPHTAGEFDGSLAAMLDEIRAQDEMLFRELRLDALLEDAGAGAPVLGDPEAVPELQAEAMTQVGDLYEMGAHRLVCGDATDRAVWERLEIGRPALVFTSPPYGVGASAKLRDHYVRGAEVRESLYNDHDDDPDQWPALMRAWTANALACADCVVCNVQSLANNKRAVFAWVTEFATHLVDTAIWDKNRGAPQMQPNVFANWFEWLFILSPKENAPRSIPLASFHGNESNIVRVTTQTMEHGEVHRASMPVGLPEWAIKTVGATAASVVDPFAGTGTTLIAAEAVGKRGFMVELDPLYCDVIVQRWEDFTGKKAVRNGAS